MAASLITLFRWSLFEISSIILVLLWVFNPLGSQASFRGAYLRERNDTKVASITYMNPDFMGGLQSASMFNPGINSYGPLVRALYTTVLYDTASRTQYLDERYLGPHPADSSYRDIIASLGGQKTAAVQAATDPWGHARIPHLEYLNTYNPNDAHQWLNTPWTNEIQGWSSLIGDIVQGVSPTFTGNTISTSLRPTKSLM
jgi:hypothetical protein